MLLRFIHPVVCGYGSLISLFNFISEHNEITLCKIPWFLYSPVDICLGCFQIYIYYLGKIAINIVVYVSWSTCVKFFQALYQGVDILGERICHYLTLKDNAKLLFIVVCLYSCQ